MLSARNLLVITLAVGELTGCMTIPSKPIIEHCELNFQKLIANCAMSNDPDNVYEIPVSDLDHATLFRPTTWERIKNYIDKLRDFAERD